MKRVEAGNGEETNRVVKRQVLGQYLHRLGPCETIS